MKKILLIIITMLLITLSACSNLTQDTSENDQFDDIVVPENKILAMYRQVNHAWGYQDYGWFIMSDGNVYTFDFSQYVNITHSYKADEIFTQKINMVPEHTEPLATFSEADIRKLYAYVLKIDCNETYESEPMACDAGTSTLRFYNGTEDKMILCRQWGDLEGELTSKAAKKLLKYFDNSLLPIINDAKEMNSTSNFYVYTDTDINLFNKHCGYIEAAGRYLIQNDKDIRALKKLTGIDLYTYRWDGMFPSERHIYFVEIINAPTMEQAPKATGIMVKNGEISFFSDAETQLSKESSTNEEALDGYCFICELPSWTVNEYYNSETDTYNLIDWTRP